MYGYLYYITTFIVSITDIDFDKCIFGNALDFDLGSTGVFLRLVEAVKELRLTILVLATGHKVADLWWQNIELRRR